MRYLLLSLFISISFSSFSQPIGFGDEIVSDEFDTPVGITFDHKGGLYVWEKGGKVFKLNKSTGEKLLLLDISEEVYNYLDQGLNGLALHPNFENNGYMYLLYPVDRNYLFFKDSTFYDPALGDQFAATIGRVTRYTINSDKVDVSSRKVILGENHRNAIPILMDNHGLGSLVFGADTSLMVTCGDVAIAKDPPFQNGDAFYYELVTLPLEEGIITEEQNVGPYRSQVLTSLNGKMLRINPSNGDGYPSNPFYDPSNPSAPQSRIWAYGLRNPFRFSLKPETGSTNPDDGDPGVFLVGDVGWASREEVNRVDAPGLNFGWPKYEGISYENQLFQDQQYAPSDAVEPIIEWRGDKAQVFIDGEAYSIGSPEFKGENFSGNSSIGGIWLTSDHFSKYKGDYIQGDYEGWIKIFRFDFRDSPYEVVNIINDVSPVCFAEDPSDGSIYYLNVRYPTTNEVHRLYSEPNPNEPPVLNTNVSTTYGASPLTIKFDASQSFDPEGENVKFKWDFGNGQFSEDAITEHIYRGDKEQLLNAKLTVTDERGKAAAKKFKVFLNNFPPEIKSTTIDDLSSFENEAGLAVDLDAEVTNHDEDETLYYEWSIILHHEDHSHLITSYKTLKAKTVLAPIPCDGQSYSYEIKLFVHDDTGLGPVYSRMITPNCPSIVEPEPPKPLSLSLSPNPVELEINLNGIDNLDEKEVSYQLYDTGGKALFGDSGVWKNLKLNLNKELNLHSTGTYLLKVMIGDQSKTFKFLKY